MTCYTTGCDSVVKINNMHTVTGSTIAILHNVMHIYGYTGT